VGGLTRARGRTGPGILKEATIVSAKHKLNSAYFIGSFLIASLLGALTQSFVAFVITLIVLLTAAYHAGHIRN
jgi:hypothetical protein